MAYQSVECETQNAWSVDSRLMAVRGVAMHSAQGLKKFHGRARG